MLLDGCIDGWFVGCIDVDGCVDGICEGWFDMLGSWDGWCEGLLDVEGVSVGCVFAIDIRLRLYTCYLHGIRYVMLVYIVAV